MIGVFVDYLEPLKIAFREKRFVIREFNYDASKAGSLNSLITSAQQEVKQILGTIVRWCKAHYGEIYVAWVHLKIIRAFVESVLRYGLPLEFLSLFIEPNMKKEKILKNDLISSINIIRPELVSKRQVVPAEEEDDDTDQLPFVFHKININGASSSS